MARSYSLTVKDVNGNIVPDALGEAYRSDNGNLAETKYSDANGLVSFTALPEDTDLNILVSYASIKRWYYNIFYEASTPRILVPCHPLFVPGYYYASPLNAFSPSDISWDDFLANTLYVFAYPIPRRIQVSKIAIEIGGASGTSGSTLRMALYSASKGGTPPTGIPYKLIRDFGTVATDTTGVKVIDFSANMLILPADLYWLVLNNSDALVDIIGSKATMGIFGYSDRPINASGFYISYTYGAFPDSFPWDATKTAHKIGLRYGFWVDSLVG